MNDDEYFLRNVGGLKSNSLSHLLQLDEHYEDSLDGEPEIIIHSPYFNDEKLINKIKNKQIRIQM